MSPSRDGYFTDAAKLAEGFLIANCIWEPGGDGCHELGELHPALQRHLAADSIEQGQSTLRRWKGQFYRWRSGRYVPVADSDMQSLVTQHFSEHNKQISIFRACGEQRVNITTALVKNIMLCLGIKGVYLPAERELNTWDDERQHTTGTTIVFNNGLLTHAVGEEPAFTQHTPAYFTLTKLPYDYDPHAACPRWLEFLDEVMEADAERILLLARWAGYLLTANCKRQKFLLIAGDGRNGKTVFATMLERMVGLDNVTHIPLSMFSQPFALASTLGKALNSTSESSHSLDEFAETMFKSMVSGDRMSFQRKYREPLDATPTAKIMISTNHLPQFSDKSYGVWRRLLFVPFERSIPEHLQNPDLVEELSAELPGIFNWARQGLARLEADGRFANPKKCIEATAQYRRDVNPARAFLLDNYISGLEYEGLPSSEVYDSYTTWCINNGHRPMSNTTFGKEVKRTFPTVTHVQSRRNGRRIRIYSGMVVRDGSEITDYNLSTRGTI